MSSLSSNARIFSVLVRRDLKVLRARLWGIGIDKCILLAVSVFVFGHMLPRMGMPKELIGPIFIGSTFMLLFEMGFSWAAKFVHDIKFNRFIDYRLGLPLSIHWLLAAYVAQFMMEAALLTMPSLAIGILLLGSKFTIVYTNWALFGLIYFLSLLFCATLFLFYGFVSEFDWFWANIWTRRLDILFLFGAVFVVWKKVYALSGNFQVW